MSRTGFKSFSAVSLILISLGTCVQAGPFTLIRTIDNPAPEPSDQFGESVAVADGRILIGASTDNASGPNVGQAYLYDAATGALLQTFDDPTPTTVDRFGSATAISGNRVLIGASRDDTNNDDNGQVHLFDTTTGSLIRTFNNPDGQAQYNNFGREVHLSGDRVLISSGHEINGAQIGRVHMFDAATGAYIRAFDDPTPTAHDGFGQEISVSGDRVLMSAGGDDSNGPNHGQVHMFDLTTGALLRTFDNPSPAPLESFGTPAISGDRVLIGAARDDTNGNNAGQAYLFDANTGQLIRTIDDPAPREKGVFGNELGIFGGYLLISANRDPDGNGDTVLHLFDAETGALLQTLEDPVPHYYDAFGYSFAIDGDLLVVGAFGDDTFGFNVGQVHVFALSDIVTSAPEPAALLLFGLGIAIIAVRRRQNTGIATH